MKTNLIVLLSCALLIILSCKRRKEIIVIGTVINKATQHPIQDVKVTFIDGIDVSGPLDFGGTSPENIDSTYTDANGRFRVEFKTKSGGGFISVEKKGYTYAHPGGGGVYPIDEPGAKDIFIKMDGVAYFNAVFKKTSAVSKDDDLLVISEYMLDSDFEYPSPFTYKGKGPFSYLTDNQNEGVYMIGDRYHYFKLKYTTNGVWYTKIDSVFIPTSTEIFKDTIYY